MFYKRRGQFTFVTLIMLFLMAYLFAKAFGPILVSAINDSIASTSYTSDTETFLKLIPTFFLLFIIIAGFFYVIPRFAGQ